MSAVVAHPPRRRRRHVRRASLMALTMVIAVTVVAFALFGRQIVSYLTHWKGSPTHTEAYVPFDPAPPLHLAVAGDIGDSGARLNATAAAMADIGADVPYDVLLLLGDNVYPDGDPDRLDEVVFGPFAPMLDTGTDLLAILGNHDVSHGHGDEQIAALGMPGRYWAKEYGDVLFVGLDSNTVDDPTQLAWLDETLGTSDATWKIVAVHHPPYSAGYQGSSTDVRETFGPLFEEHGVQLVLSGHDHDYQRSKVINGVTYVVSGAGAGTRRTGDADFTEVSWSWHHFVDIGIFPDRLVLRAVNQDGRVADEATLLP